MSDQPSQEQTHRIYRLSQHLGVHCTNGATKAPPVVKATAELSSDPVAFLMSAKAEHPDMFFVDRKGFKYLVVCDDSLFEDILTFDKDFGTPQSANMQVNANIFGIDRSVLDAREKTIIQKLRKFLLNNNHSLANSIAYGLLEYLNEYLGDSGEIDLRELGEAVFWPMTTTLFGQAASRKNAPGLLAEFETIDTLFGKALSGKPVPAVQASVRSAATTFLRSYNESKSNPSKCPMPPLLSFYEDALEGTGGDEAIAQFATAAWWGGQGNTIPSTVWTFGLILADATCKQKAYAEVDSYFKHQPATDGSFDFDQLEYLTAALKEALRVKTYSVAWRTAQHDVELTSKSGTQYSIPRDTLIGVHFATQHNDESLFKEPKKFRPERFLAGQEESKGNR
jgi:cytochrome P450